MMLPAKSHGTLTGSRETVTPCSSMVTVTGIGGSGTARAGMGSGSATRRRGLADMGVSFMCVSTAVDKTGAGDPGTDTTSDRNQLPGRGMDQGRELRFAVAAGPAAL